MRIFLHTLSLWALLLFPLTGFGQSLSDLFSRIQSNTGGPREISEQNIWILKPDGRSYTKFVAYSSPDGIAIGTTKGGGPSDYLYFFPSNVSTRSRNATTDEIVVPPGGYSYMHNDVFTEGDFPGIKRNQDGSFTFKYWDGKTYGGPRNRFFGISQWNGDGSNRNFDHLTVVWIVPENIEIVKYEANRSGRWTLKDGVLAFYCRNTNNLDYSVTYRVRNSNIEEAKTLP